MQLYQVNGTVTLSRAHPSFHGASLKTAEAYGESLLGKKSSDPLVNVLVENFGIAGIGTVEDDMKMFMA